MGEFSLTHIVIIALIFLVFFGPSRLPGLGKSIGQAIKGFKAGLNEIDAEAKPVQEAHPEQLTEAKKATDPNATATAQQKETHKS